MYHHVLFSSSFGNLLRFVVCCLMFTGVFPTFDTQGPSFLHEPRTRVEFTNSVGGRADCSARGNPAPSVEWLGADNIAVSSIPNIRHVLSNGSVYFPPFEAEAFRQDVHWAVYRCIVSNTVGVIVSRDVTIRAVVNQRYEPEVQNPGGFLGNNVIIRCSVPSFVKEHVAITSWLQEPSFNIYPSTLSDGKYHMLPTGELMIINITRSDAQRTYRCRTHHQLTQEAVVSPNVGRIQLTEMREAVPPILNEKHVQLSCRLDDTVVVPCVAYANPRPTYRWHIKRNGRDEFIENGFSSGHFIIRDGTLVISNVKETDAGSYFCTAANEGGSETLEVQLSVTAPLSIHVQPARQTVDLGKLATLVCSVTGLPQAAMWWLKDGQPLRTGSRVRVVSREQVQIAAVAKEDRGMYQCFVRNDQETAQGVAELRLGEVSPQLVYKFIEQTMQPGPSVSLKCSATGNPTPQITWTLDGFPLPQNDRLMIGQYVTVFGDVISHVNISAVKAEDGGEYECQASSRAGASSHGARLNIYGMPHVRQMPPISAVAGKSLNIKCPVAGYPIDSVIWEKVPPKITPFTFDRDLNVGDRTSIQCVVVTGDLPLSFTWLKDETVISSDGDLSGTNTGNSAITTIRQYDDFTSALSITSITRAQSGLYTCRVQNDAATIFQSAQLRVNVPPRISPFYFEESVTEGMRTQLMCTTSQGDQPFNITWLRDTTPLTMNYGQELNSSIQISDYAPFSSILTINNVTSKDSGNYTCQIKNRAGIADYSASLSVSVPPRWIVEPMDQSAVLGNAVTLSCKADGFPVPTVNWKQAIGEQSGEYRELNYASGLGVESISNGTLVIARVGREHEGFFLCQASNGIGAGLSKLIRLTVYVGPRVTVRARQENVRRGDRVTLRCEADGDQPLDVSWRIRGSRIDAGYDVRYVLKNSPVSRGMVSELTIAQASLTDRGEYSCVGSNAYGHDHTTVQLQIQEPPNFPRNLHAAELGSRSVLLGWSNVDKDVVTSDSSQPVSNYILQYKEAQDVWHEHNTKKHLSGDKTAVLVSSLTPATGYHFRLYAENHLGISAPSDILHIQTEGEVPSGSPLKVSVEPLGPQELLVTWRPPERDLWNGELLGYTIGYHKVGGSNTSYNHTRVGTAGGESVNDFRLTGLDKYTKYSVTVKAFNSKGDGPGSEPIIAHTLEDVPSAPPQGVKCVALTAQNIQVSWQPPPSEATHGLITGYKLFYEPANSQSDYGNRETKITSALSTVLHGLQPYTNYSVQVLALTRPGEGVSSPVTSCTTDETVPDAPEKVKAIVSSEDTVIISWLPPRRPNGIVTKYTVFIRVLDQGQEVKIIKGSLLAQHHHYDATGLKSREAYEAWVTASTKVGQGPSTPVIKLIPSSTIPASIISFGQVVLVAWRVDVKLACLYVGLPKPTAEWRVGDIRVQKQPRLEVGADNTLTLRNVHRTHEGNYSCYVRNTLGTDHIVYSLQVQVPPDPPVLFATSSTQNSVQIQWKPGDTGGSPIRGFLLAYRREFSDWEEMLIDRRASTYFLEQLMCGTRYQFTLAAFNKIGSGSASSVESARTRGNKPVSPRKEHLIRPNVTSVLLELGAWQDGGCPISHFIVEYKRNVYNSDWVLISNNVAPQARFPINDLESASGYNLRVTANNNAGATVAEYFFETLNPNGQQPRPDTITPYSTPDGAPIYLDAHIIAPTVVSLVGLILAVAGLCFCFKYHPRRNLMRRNSEQSTGPQAALDNKHNLEQREQYYATVRKPIAQSPCRDVSALERIPEYSEDIYPYATFHLPEQENMSANPLRPSCAYDSRDTISVKQVRCVTSGAQSVNSSTGQRCRRKSKSFKSESEEYDSLGSDSDTASGDQGTSSRTESSNHLDDPSTGHGHLSHSYSPGVRGNGKDRHSHVPQPSVHHNVLLHTHESNISTDQPKTSEHLNQLDNFRPCVRSSLADDLSYLKETKSYGSPTKMFEGNDSLRYQDYVKGTYQNVNNEWETFAKYKQIPRSPGLIKPLDTHTHPKPYGDFLTLTPKRKPKNVRGKSVGSVNVQMLRERLLPASESWGNIRQTCADQDTETLNLLGLRDFTKYQNCLENNTISDTHYKHMNGYAHSDELENSNTLKLVSEPSNYPINNANTSMRPRTPKLRLDKDEKMKLSNNSDRLSQSVSPPTGFNDHSETECDFDLSLAKNTISNNKYSRTQKDFTIAV